MLKKLSWILLIASVSGCGVMPVPTLTESGKPNKIEAVPAERLFAFQEKNEEATSTIVVTRDSSFGGSACYQAVSINGKIATRIGSGETATFYVPPGAVQFMSGYDPYGKGFCSPVSNTWAQTKLSIKPSETKHFILSLQAPGPVIVQSSTSPY